MGRVIAFASVCLDVPPRTSLFTQFIQLQNMYMYFYMYLSIDGRVPWHKRPLQHLSKFIT